MGKLDDLLNKAQGLKAKESELFKETRIRMERNGQLKAKLIELQNNKKLLEILGNFPLKGKVISFYSMPMEAEETDEAPDDVEPDQKSLMVMYDFLERQVPYVHFIVGLPEKQRSLDISNSADIRYLASVFPELTPEMVEEKLYEAISRELDDPEENPELIL